MQYICYDTTDEIRAVKKLKKMAMVYKVVVTPVKILEIILND